MVRSFLTSIAFLTGLLVLTGCEEVETADYIFWGGPIYTGVDARPTVEVVAVKDGKILFAGEVGPGRSFAGPDTLLVELGDRALFPGFADSHVHLLSVGLREMSLDLSAASSIDHLLELLTAWKRGHPEETITLGRGWIETHWPEGRFPTRFDIDAVTGKTPTLLTRADGHALLANSAALEAAGVTATTEAPFGGEILRFEDGEPTGMLIDAAQGLVRGLVPEQSKARKEMAFKEAFSVYAERGWVHAHNMSASLDEVELLERMSDRGEVPLKVYNSVQMSEANGIIGTGHSYSQDRTVRTRAVKLFVDGALGSRGAALLEPYSDAETSGLLLVKREDILPILKLALEYGVQINTHAIGDKANRLVLDWYEEAFQAVPVEDRALAEPRWRIEHAQVIAREDLDRFAKLGVIASMQPSHAISDLYFAPDRLGEARLSEAYAWRSLLDAGAIIAAGSDAPVEVGDPLIEFYAAVTRRALDGFAGENWHLEQAVSRQEALKMLTVWPAYASFQDDETGTIEVGKAADFTVLSADIMRLREDQIPRARVLLTIRDGEVIYQDSEAPAFKRVGD